MLRKALKLATIAAGLVLAACSDSHLVPTSPLAPATPAASSQAAVSSDLLTSIDALITASWSKGLAQALSSQWTDVLRDLASGKPDLKTRKKFSLVVDWIQKKTPDITPPPGETNAHVAARLILYMSLYVYRDPLAPPPPPPPLTVTTDLAAGLVQPTVADTVTTPTQHATVLFPAGAVSEPTVVVIALESSLYPRNCSGPLLTKRCQYPQFYKYNVFPDVKLNIPAKVAVCHVNSGTNRAPLRPGIHDRFRLAHDLPASSANYTPNTIREGGIEIFPLVELGSAVLNCGQTNSYGAAFIRTQPGALGAVLDRTHWLVGRLASAVLRVLSPKDVYAIDVGGGGGETDFFSTFADVDPQSLPDLQPAGFAVQESAVFAGETMHITALAATNLGTASAGATTTSIRLSTDPTITTADVELASQVQPDMVPNDTTNGAALTVVIPASTAPGTYYIGMLTDAGNTESEESETNNFVSIPFTVKRIVSTTAITCPASVSYTGVAQSPCTAAVTAAGLSLVPTPTYTNNTSAGTATATYNYPGDARYAPSTDTRTFLITPAATITAITCPTSVVYNGGAQTPCTATVTGPALTADATQTYTNNTNGGTATASASYAGEANYAASSATKNFQVAPAPTVTTLTCPTSAIYTGSPQTCTATTTGPGTPGSPAITYTNNSNAGTVTATATFTVTANYLTSSDTKSFTIAPAATTTAVTCPTSSTFTGSPQTPCTGTATGPGLSSPLTPTYANNTNVGTATATATFAAAGNYLGSTDTKSFQIAPAATTTALSCPSSATYTGSPITPCTATTTGTGLTTAPPIAYTNNTAMGTVTATATFTAAGNYFGSTDTKTFQITPAATTTTIACPASVDYTSGARTPCTATVTGPGLEAAVTPTYTNNTNGGTATASANYAGGANYAASSATSTFQIAPASTTTTLTCPTSATYTGSPQTCTTTTTGPGAPGSPAITYTDNVNTGTVTATATFTATTNYLTSTDTKSFTIAAAATTTAVTCPTSSTFTGSPQTPCTGTATGPGLSSPLTPTYANNTNVGTATATATFAAAGNYLGSTDTKSFQIAPAATTTALSCPSSSSYTGSPVTPCSATTTGPGFSTTPPVAYTNNTAIGTATAIATFTATGNYLGSTDTKTFAIAVSAGALTINPASVEKLPSGTQSFSVVSGGPGPYTWSVNGVTGGNATFGTITSGGAYTAPTAVPTPATFNVCAQMQSPPSNTGCASVTIKPIPSTGGEVVVFNDINLFDIGAPIANNQQFFRNLVQFTASGARASQTGVMMHRGHSSKCGTAGGPCTSGALGGFYSVLTGAGFSITNIDDNSATVTSIPASIKVLFLWNPLTSYASAEINVMKQFASEGGRIIFVGEHAGYYGTVGIATENAFFASMGAQMTNQGGAYDCGRVDLPASSLRPHQITAGLNGLTIACASRVLPGPNDYPLFYNSGNTILLGAVAKVDLTPLGSASFVASAQLIRVPTAATKNEAPAGMEYVSWTDVPMPKPQP